METAANAYTNSIVGDVDELKRTVWHRYTLIVGDTGGGYGGCIAVNDHTVTVPEAVKINNGPEVAFSTDNFQFGSSTGANTITRSEDCDWSALGTVTLDNDVTLDLNGHTLTVDAPTASYPTVTVTS